MTQGENDIEQTFRGPNWYQIQNISSGPYLYGFSA